MSRVPAKPNDSSRPAGAADEDLLDDLAAGHVGELSRRSAAAAKPQGAPPRAGGERADRTPAGPHAETGPKPPPAEPGAERHREQAGGPQQEPRDADEQTGGAVEALLSAVERVAARRPRRTPQRSALLGGVPRRRPSLKLSPRLRAAALQAGAVAAGAAGAAGTAVLAWLMFA